MAAPLNSPTMELKGAEDLSAVLDLIVVSAVQILEGSAGAIALWDEAGRRFIPQSSFGLEPAAIRALHPRLDQPLLSILGRAGESVPLVWIQERGLGPNQSRREHILALPLSQAQTLVGVIYVFRPPSARQFQVRDVSLLEVFARQAAAAIQASRLVQETLAERRRLEGMQSSFVGIVSHELQTPIAIIKGYASTLRRPDTAWRPEVIRRVATTIEEECDRLQTLVTDLLDISRIQAGRVAMSFGPVDLAELVREATQAMQVRAPGHQIRLELEPDLSEIRADAEKLRRALQNLIDNAAKYSPEGTEIVVGVRRAGPEVHLSVRDRGPGVPPGEREHVFERFHRVDTGLSRATPGVGLGLYIVRAIAEAHGGRVWVDSPADGVGSVFNIALPVERSR